MGKANVMNLAESNIAGLGTDLEKKCRVTAGDSENAWAGVGQKPGLKVWRIENFKVVPRPESDYGKFYSGDSYIVMNSYQQGSSPKLLHDIHFWLGLETTQDEAGTAAYKTVELDDHLGCTPVQHREVQGAESPLFLSYFKYFIVEQGGVDSGFDKVTPTTYRPRLLHIYSPPKAAKTRAAPKLIIREVPMTYKSLNEGDVFVADLGLELLQWNGAKASGIEKAKAAEFVRKLDDDRKGKPVVTVFEQGDSCEPFWAAIGGKGEVAPPIDETAQQKNATSFEKVLYRLSDASGKVEFKQEAKGTIKRSVLDSKDVFIYDNGCEVTVWIGKESNKNERALAMQHALEYVQFNKRPLDIPVSRVLEGGDTTAFDSGFDA